MKTFLRIRWHQFIYCRYESWLRSGLTNGMKLRTFWRSADTVEWVKTNISTKPWINVVNPECIDAIQWWNWLEPKISPLFDFPPCIIITQEETLALRKEGIGVVLDSELPHLIGIDDDLLSTGIILYHLKVWFSRGKLSDINVLFLCYIFLNAPSWLTYWLI